MRRLFLVAVLAGLACTAAAAEWHSTDDSRFTFEAVFEGDALPGEFRRFDVVLRLDAASEKPAALEATVDLASADLGDPDMNDVLHDDAWFGTKTYTQATFVSDHIAETEPGRYLATGVLDLKGVQQTIEIPFSWKPDGDAATILGHTSLRRTDFDVGTGEWATGDTIGLDVDLDFDVRLVLTE